MWEGTSFSSRTQPALLPALPAGSVARTRKLKRTKIIVPTKNKNCLAKRRNDFLFTLQYTDAASAEPSSILDGSAPRV